MQRSARYADRARVASAGFAAVVAIALSGCSSSDVDQTTPGTRYEFDGATPAGQVIDASQRVAAPEFSGELLDGTPFRSDDLEGAIAVINFWGSWCAPCRVETSVNGRFGGGPATAQATTEPGASASELGEEGLHLLDLSGLRR